MIAALACITFIDPSTAQQPDVQIETVKLTDNIYMLVGAGGNIGVSVGEDGVIMIDDQHAAANSAILASVATITDKPVKFLINTHWHADHTDGNELMGKAGSIIIAHDNVRKTLSEKQFIEFFDRPVEPLPEAGLPAITFTDAVTFHFNGDEIYVLHTEPAHTDGDVIVYFKNANVVHAGDIVFSGMYPFIDHERDGSAEGLIRVVGRLLETIDDSTEVIPGHGELCGKQYLKDYHYMLSTITSRVKAMMSEGKTLDEIVAVKPTAEFDEKFSGFIGGDDFVGLVYKSLR
ncbi:MAG: MBL fold metallo-hydrolase [Candidatus Zixiibacteriota bacterium]|nr:MAG: MBL fold metallo-hydrolase [candidate division Zixibacteria bacterium]